MEPLTPVIFTPVAAGSQEMNIIQQHIQPGDKEQIGLRYYLPVGIYLIQMAWGGKESMSLLVNRDATKAGSTPVYTMPSSPTAQPRQFSTTLTLAKDGYLRIVGGAMSQATIDAGYAVGVTITPMDMNMAGE